MHKETIRRMLEDKEIFADVVNALLAAGTELFSSEDFRNLKMDFSQESVFENETIGNVIKESDYAIFQILICDGTETEFVKKYLPVYAYEQVGEIYLRKLEDRMIPVITWVLYLGVEHWDTSESIRTALEVSEEICPFVNDYQIHIFRVSQFNLDQCRMFKSRFRVVAEDLVRTRLSKKNM